MKHFAAHSGPEKGRHSFNSVVSKKDLAETYFPAFERCVKEAGVEGVMGGYNRLNGEAACGSHHLITEILRENGASTVITFQTAGRSKISICITG